jgi:hypothetical protein
MAQAPRLRFGTQQIQLKARDGPVGYPAVHVASSGSGRASVLAQTPVALVPERQVG